VPCRAGGLFYQLSPSGNSCPTACRCRRVIRGQRCELEFRIGTAPSCCTRQLVVDAVVRVPRHALPFRTTLPVVAVVSPVDVTSAAWTELFVCRRGRVARRPSMVCSDCSTVLYRYTGRRTVAVSTANNGELSLSSRRPDLLFGDGCKLYNADCDTV